MIIRVTERRLFKNVKVWVNRKYNKEVAKTIILRKTVWLLFIPLFSWDKILSSNIN